MSISAMTHEAHSDYAAPTYTLRLVDVGTERLRVMMTIRALWPEIGLHEARALVDGAPLIVREEISRDDLHDVQVQFRGAGAVVELICDMDGRTVR